MDSTLAALQTLILKALPTFFLLVVLHFYLKHVFFKPLEKALQASNDATEGMRHLAEETLRHAEQKTAEYEEAIRQARNEIYKEEEELRRAQRQRQLEAVNAMRQTADAMVEEARSTIAAEVEAARASLERESEALADEIAAAVLRRRVN